MAAEVRGLPGALGVLVGECERQRPPAQRAARVAAPVRADEQDRIGQVRTELVERHRGQGLDVEVSGAANGPDGHGGGLGVDEDRAAHRVVGGVALVPPHELQAQAEALRRRGRIGAEAVGDGIGPPRRSVLQQQPATALVDGAGEGLPELLGEGRAAHRCGERHSAWAGISRRVRTGEKRTGRKERLAPIADTQSTGHEAEHGAEDAADQRADRDRAPDDEAHRGVHAPKHTVGRDRLAQPDLVDVVDHDAEADDQPSDDEDPERVVLWSQRHGERRKPGDRGTDA